MSFFAHNPYYPQQRRSVVHPTAYAAGPGHFGQHPFATQSPAPQFNFYNQGYGNDYYPQYEVPHQHVATSLESLDDEERAAIAHLRSIQRRKEHERITRENAERERVIAQLQARREAREAAIAAKDRARQEREVALARARIEKERQLAIAHRMREVEARRRAEIEAQERQHFHQQYQAAARAQLNERRRQCARHCAARRAEPERQAPATAEPQTASNDDGLEGLNRLLGSLFGIQLDTSDAEEAAKSPETPAAHTEEKEEAVTVPAPVATTTAEDPAEPVLPTTATEPATAAAAEKTEQPSAPATEQKKAEFPDVINDVLANFLGLRVEPESKLGQAVSNKVPEGLNELLGQFGLEFVPDAATKTNEAGPSQPSKADTTAPSAPQSVPAPQTAESSRPQYPFDLSEFLKGDNGLPPFVRDILGNVELAFKNDKDEKKEQEVQGKGKGVAEGEKKVSPAASEPAAAPAPAAVEEDQKSTTSTASIDKLESIASEVRLARDSFTFPSTLSFSHSAPTENVPSLLFNKQNKPYHAQNNKLLQLLLQADGVVSNGDRDVRRKRKEVVKLVETELEGLEKRRDEMWRSVKERRETGNESSDDESSSWTTGSTVDHEEVVHVEDVAATPAEQAQESAAQEDATTADAAEAAQPTNEVSEATPTTFAEAVKSTESQAEQAVETVAGTSTETETKPEVSTKDKEEGYELL